MADRSQDDHKLAELRGKLDALDETILECLGRRLNHCREIAAIKAAHDIPMMQPQRVKAVRRHYATRGAELDIPKELAVSIAGAVLGTTCRLEDEIIDARATAGHGDATTAGPRS
jgi:4-amino-4-deoxychorismate mutase